MSRPPDLNAAVRAPTCLETRSRVFFFDSDEPEQRHRVLIEFGLCAGVALGTDHRPLRACPFVSSRLEHLLQTTSTGCLCRTGFHFDVISRPPHAATACCRSKVYARTSPTHFRSFNARTLSIVAYRPFARVPPFSSHSDQHSAGGIANGVGAHRT